MRRIFGLLSILLGLAACSDDESARECESQPATTTLTPRAEGIACDATATSSLAGSFEPTHMLCVDVTMDPVAFEALRFDSRFGPLDSGCFSEDVGAALADCTQPWPNEFVWHAADVLIDGIALKNVGVRKKGTLGSVLSTSPSLKFRTNKYNETQRLGDAQRVTLNNNVEDEARLTSCLGYELFAKAGLPAPQCNLANVMVNGRALGAYTHIEALKKAFLRRSFGNDTGGLYEGTDVDFLASFHGRWETKTKDTDPLALSVTGIEAALQLPDEDLLTALGVYLNIDNFVSYWSLELLLNHEDGFTAARNNAVIYFNPNDAGRGTFIPWSLGGWRETAPVVFSLFNQSLLTQRLLALPSIRQQLKEKLELHLVTVFDEEELLARVEASAVLVRSAETVPDYETKLALVRDWILSRRAAVEDLLSRDFDDETSPAAQCGAAL